MKRLCKLLLPAVALMLASCSRPELPDSFSNIKEMPEIYPDYTNIVIPPNIAPLNFMVKEKGSRFAVLFKSENIEALVVAAGEDGKIQIDETEWKSMLAKSKGKDITVDVFAENDGAWGKYESYTLSVAQEPVDSYVSYRLIEPGYEMYRQLGLYQRNLTNFDVKTIYENNRTYDDENNHCVNCHNYQNYSCGRMLFHVRGAHGGTIIASNGNIQKVNMKSDSVLSSAVYPTWHPKLPYVIFSSNMTGQVFHMLDNEKIEVLDWASDLIFYDAKRNVLRNILKTRSAFETFPCWAPNGKDLYYTCAFVNELDKLPDSLAVPFTRANYRNIRYDVMKITFDPTTQKFSKADTVVSCASHNKSASVPRVSPDGRYVLFTLGDFGQFHIWHRSADLYVKDLESGRVYPLTEANSRNTESYHGWSSNGRWIVFVSRRDDGSFSRLYLTYFDKGGRAHKAFMIPQLDPMQNVMLLKSYNVPEMTKDPVTFTAEDFKSVIYGNEEAKVKFESAPSKASGTNR